MSSNAAPLQLRAYQQEAVSRTIAHFRESDEPACIVLPTGAGKSLVIAELARRARGRLLVLAHVSELCQQNYEKLVALGGDAGLFAAGLGKKQLDAQVTFATVQSVARNLDKFTESYSLLIIDECHRLSGDAETQYGKIIEQLRRQNPRLKVLGLTATPYRLGLGWIYRTHARGVVRTSEARPFEICIYEHTLSSMIAGGYLTRPRLVDAPVAQYDFRSLTPDSSGRLPAAPINELLVRHARVTQSIVLQVQELAADRQGVMLFAATVEHAREVASYLPADEVALILGETSQNEREQLIGAFKQKKRKYLVNVAVLTTGFDAPHVDLIAILRPTESVSLFQQIAGRGLRLAPGKEDCLIIDYAGSGFGLHTPEVGEPRPAPDTEPVEVGCPECGHQNLFWGRTDAEGHVTEHFGRRCAALLTGEGGRRAQCTFRFRFKECARCGAQNDIAARSCSECRQAFTDPDDQLKAALQLKDARVLRVAGLRLSAEKEKLRVLYHDEDGAELRESFDLAAPGPRAAFFRIFALRTTDGLPLDRTLTAAELVRQQARLKSPDFVVARRQKHYFRIQERIFDYVGRYRKAGALS